MTTIAVVEDDQPIGNLLEEVLEKEGYRVLRAWSGTEALFLLERERPDLVLLDLMLPGLPGEQVLGKLHGIPVIVVSAKTGVDDKVNALLGGAADYLTKPFEIRELLARIQLRLKSASPDAAPVYRSGDLQLDTLSRAVTAGGVPVHLTKTEYAVLKLLISSRALSVAACLLTSIVLMSFSQKIFSALEQPEHILSQYVLTENGATLLENAGEGPLNPDHVDGVQRTVFQFINDLLPTGQAFQIVNLTVERPWLLLGCSLALVLLTTGLGLFLFRKKDVK